MPALSAYTVKPVPLLVVLSLNWIWCIADMAKLTAKQWEKVRKTWELDERPGYAWIVQEMELPVSRAAISKRAKAEGWEKRLSGNKPAPQEKAKTRASEKVTQKAKVTEKVTQKVTQEVTPATTERGRPTEYHDEYAEQAYRLMLLGMTRSQVAQFFEVSESTIYNWCHKHPDFLESIKRGATLADADVAESLFRRALGVVLPETHVSNYQGEVTLTDLEKHYPPDTQAARMWLKNRQPELWKDKVEIEEKPTIALVDREEMDTMYRDALDYAAQVEKQLKGRAERLGLTIDHDDIGVGVGGDDLGGGDA